MSLINRIQKLEKSISAAAKKARGFQFFYTYDDQTYYQRESAALASYSPISSPAPIDYRNACAGAGGDPGPDDKTYSRQEVDQVAANGWQVIIIQWVEMGAVANA